MNEEYRLRIAYDSFGEGKGAIFAGNLNGRKCIYHEGAWGKRKMATFEDGAEYAAFLRLMQSLSQRTDWVKEAA